MIKGTNANCTILKILVTKTNAFVTFIISSVMPSAQNFPFKFYIKDYDNIEKTTTRTLISNNRYWIDRLDNYVSDSNNIDINMYKEITFKIDITNKYKSPLVEGKFVRECQFYLLNDSTNEIAWESNKVTLISEKIEVPKITNVIINTDTNFITSGSFKYEYKSDADFNFNNSHLFTEIIVKSPQTDDILETVRIEDEDALYSTVKFQLLKTYDKPILIVILLKSYTNSEKIISEWLTNPNNETVHENDYIEKVIGGTVIETYKILYVPTIKYSNLYIKVNGVVKRLTDLYYLKEAAFKKLFRNNVGLFYKPFNLEDVKLAIIGDMIVKAYQDDEYDYFNIYKNDRLLDTINSNVINLNGFLIDDNITIQPIKLLNGVKNKYKLIRLEDIYEVNYKCCDEADELITVCSNQFLCM